MKLKKIFSSIGILALLIGQGNNIFAQGITSDKFQYYKEIQQEGEGLRSLEIDSEVYGFTAYSSPDMRIFDTEGVEVPYHKYSGFSPKSRKISDFSIINRSDDNGIIKATFVKEDSLEVYNKITIEMDGGNFLLSPQLYGSQDGIDFSPIGSKGYIYSFEDENKGSNYTISFGEVDYQYIRAEFEIAMGKVSSEDIIRVSYTRNLPYISVQKQIDSTMISTSNIDKTTEIIIDVKYTHLPVSSIIVNTDNENYYRELKVLTSDDGKEFDLISEDRISSFDIGDYKVENKEIKIDSPCRRYVKLIINNQDNAPLKIEDIDIFYQPDTLVFEAKTGKIYRLYYGSRACEAPIYDISYIADKIDEKYLQKSQLGQANKNPDYTKQDIPFTERNNYIIIISIALVVGVLGFVVVKNIRDK